MSKSLDPHTSIESRIEYNEALSDLIRSKDEELSAAIRVCQQERGRMIRQWGAIAIGALKETAEYQENNATEDRLLDELFKLRFPRAGLVAGANQSTSAEQGDEHARHLTDD